MTAPARRRWNDPRLAWFAWAALFAVTAALVLAGSRRTVTGNYREAAFLWFLGKDLYANAVRTGHGFLYLPQAAILFAPFAWLPHAAGEIAWRGGLDRGVRDRSPPVRIPRRTGVGSGTVPSDDGAVAAARLLLLPERPVHGPDLGADDARGRG
jgi:hypothetical protein